MHDRIKLMTIFTPITNTSFISFSIAMFQIFLFKLIALFLPKKRKLFMNFTVKIFPWFIIHHLLKTYYLYFLQTKCFFPNTNPFSFQTKLLSSGMLFSGFDIFLWVGYLFSVSCLEYFAFWKYFISRERHALSLQIKCCFE